MSVVELVARIATPVDDGDWTVRALTLNVRQLRAELKARKLEVWDDTAPARVSIAMTCDRSDAWAFEQARLMVEAVGARRGDETIEAMLAEGLGVLLASDPDIDLPATLGGHPESADDRAFRLELAALRETAEGAVEAMRPKDEVVAPAVLVVSWRDDPEAVDHQLRELAATLALRDIELGELACSIVDHEVAKTFGYASFDHYCRERIGLSPSSVATRIALTRRFSMVPEVRTALAAHGINYESAALIARISSPATVGAWIERATQRAVKQLREDIDATELLARSEGRNPSTLQPPDDAARDAVDDIERTVIAAVAGLTELPASQLSGELSAPAPEAGPTTLHLSLSESAGQFWRGLERLHGQMSGGAPFVPFLVRAVLDTWRGTTDGRVAYADVYLRDRWRCASPVCRSRNVTPHHIRFRSQGGGEERSNLLSLCQRCHLELVHQRKVEVTGHAPHDLTWQARGWAERR